MFFFILNILTSLGCFLKWVTSIWVLYLLEWIVESQVDFFMNVQSHMVLFLYSLSGPIEIQIWEDTCSRFKNRFGYILKLLVMCWSVVHVLSLPPFITLKTSEMTCVFFKSIIIVYVGSIRLLEPIPTTSGTYSLFKFC